MDETFINHVILFLIFNNIKDKIKEDIDKNNLLK